MTETTRTFEPELQAIIDSARHMAAAELDGEEYDAEVDIIREKAGEVQDLIDYHRGSFNFAIATNMTEARRAAFEEEREAIIRLYETVEAVYKLIGVTPAFGTGWNEKDYERVKEAFTLVNDEMKRTKPFIRTVNKRRRQAADRQEQSKVTC